MIQAARINAVIEILDAVFKFEQPADNTINVYFRSRRYIGSKDRRFISEYVWEILRHYGRLSVLSSPLSARNAVLIWLSWQGENVQELFNGEKYAPPVLTDKEKDFLSKLPLDIPSATEECPEWLKDKIPAEEIAAMTESAQLDVRVNTLKANRDDVLAELKQQGFSLEKTPLSPVGIRFEGRPPITNLSFFQDGIIEIQDEGSQLVSLLTQAASEEVVIDWCAGAGGKTLALSVMMEAKGTLYAVDINPQRMRDLPDRAQRAGAKNVIVLNGYQNLKPAYDLVLIDAPCTGTGTWRRSPDAKWRVTAEQSAELVKIQAEILEKACRYVKKGGRLVYITCSLDKAENQEQINAFLNNHSDFKIQDLASVYMSITGKKIAGEAIVLTPARHHTDGFFVVSLIRK